MKYKKLGNTGIDISVLGFGSMRMPCKNGKLDHEQAIKLIRTAIDAGVNYIDTAYFYHDHESETLVGRAMEDGYRNRAYIATKLPMYLVKEEGDFDRLLDKQLKNLNTDNIDFYLMHGLNSNTWTNTVLPLDLCEKMLRAKKAGKINHIGFSFHDDFNAFKTIVDGFDKWEFCQIQLNYIDTHHQAGIRGLKYAADRGLGVIIMEPLLGGKLANPTPAMKKVMFDYKTPVQWGLEFLWNMPEVTFLLSGMSTHEQLLENISYASHAHDVGLTNSELDMLKQVRNIFLNAPLIPCTKCAYCMPCPFGLDIPGIFEAYNYTYIKSINHGSKMYSEMDIGANMCRECKRCEPLCPQHIQISREMPKIAENFSDFKK